MKIRIKRREGNGLLLMYNDGILEVAYFREESYQLIERRVYPVKCKSERINYIGREIQYSPI